jgi:hypothetical protein
MAIPQVNINSFTIATQAETINDIANLEGDLDNLETANKDTLVDAINEIHSGLGAMKRSILTYAIAMS